MSLPRKDEMAKYLIEVENNEIKGCHLYDEQHKGNDIQEPFCEWIKYNYRTIAPKYHDIDNPYWRISGDNTKIKYCPYCSGKIIYTN